MTNKKTNKLETKSIIPTPGTMHTSRI